MRYLSGGEKKNAIKYIYKAAQAALNSTCYRSKCGSVIVKENEIIGFGFNSPPQNKTIDHCFKNDMPVNFKSDKTCCIHAEQRAIIDALRTNPNKIIDSILYFIRLNKDNNPTRADKPYCTICSKLSLDVGIAEFILWQNDGICVYDTEEYNTISFQNLR